MDPLGTVHLRLTSVRCVESWDLLAEGTLCIYEFAHAIYSKFHTKAFVQVVMYPVCSTCSACRMDLNTMKYAVPGIQFVAPLCMIL
jgi:hypothetical protein